MLFKKLIILFILCLTTTANAQNNLDKVQLDLPAQYQQAKHKLHFEKDSTRRFQEWVITDKNKAFKNSVAIVSLDKSESTLSLNQLKEKSLERPRKKHSVTLFKTLNLKGGYSLAIYKVIVSHKVRASRGSFLIAFTETEHNLHMVLVRSSTINISSEYSKQWTKILSRITIEPGKFVPVKHTKIVLSTTKPEALPDSVVVDRITRSISSRLKKAYRRDIYPKDIQVKQGKIHLVLRGQIDTTKIGKLLSKNAAIRFMPVYQGKGYPAFLKSVKEMLRNHLGDRVDPGFYSTEAPFPAVLTRIPRPFKKEITPDLKKLFEREQFPKGIKLYRGKEGAGDARTFYLIDTRKTITDETSLVEITQVFASTIKLNLGFNKKGKKRIAAWSSQHQGSYLAIIANKAVLSAPKITTEIPDGNLQITGIGSYAEMDTIYRALEFSYPIPIKVESVNILKKP